MVLCRKHNLSISQFGIAVNAPARESGMERDRQKRLRMMLSHELRERRVAAGLGQEAVASRLRKPQSFVSKYESGARRLDLIEVLGICEALEINPCDLISKIEGGAVES